MIRRVVLVGLLALFGACFENHDPMNQAIDKTECYTCHKPEYNATGTSAFPNSPAHATSGCSTSCADCHVTAAWTNHLGSCTHPETAFPVAASSPHTGIKCIDCHSIDISNATGATAVKGANTDCISCHPNDHDQPLNHTGISYINGPYMGQPYSYSTTDHRFCLDCHPTGIIPKHTAADPFPSSHHGARCVQCHDYSSGLGHAGAMDVTCTTGGCHRSHNDPPSGTGVHLGTIQPPAPSCIARGCHPSGQGGN